MANKVTKETLKMLIEEVLKEEQLNEKTKFVTRDGKGFFDDGAWEGITDARSDLGWGANPTQDNWNILKDISDEAEVDGVEPLSFLDLKTASSLKNKKKLNAAEKKQLGAFETLDDDFKNAISTNKPQPSIVKPENFKVANDPNTADKGLNVYEPKSIAFGQMANIGMQNSDPDKPIGQIQLGIGTAMKMFFKGKDTFKSRIDALNEFTKAIFDSGSLPTDVKKLLQATLISDYLSTIVTEMDSGSGAYNFESFLAALAGGSVTGKAEEPLQEVKGQMGATDFVTADGSMGSSKYYSNGSTLDQAISNFENKEGKTTLYVIAIKKSETSGSTITGSQTTSDPTKIKVLDIYLVSIMPKVDKPGQKATEWAVQINGQKAGGGKFVNNKLVVSANDQNSLADATPIKLYISGGPNKTLKDKLNDKTEKEKDNLEKAYQRFQSLFANLTAANQNAQAYAADGDKNKGEKAMSTLQSSDKELLDLIDLIQTGSSEKLDRTTRKIKEEKITARSLKKIIEESFKKNK